MKNRRAGGSRGVTLPAVSRYFSATLGAMIEPIQPSGFAREARYIGDVGQMSDRDIARATGAGESTVRAWRAGQRNPSGERAERLAELSSLVERLVRVMDAGYIAVWLRKPVPSLDDEKPIDLIARGEYRRVSQVIASLESTAVS